MTQDEIIAMAIEAGIDIDIWEKLDNQDTFFGYSIGGIHENLEAFAKLVAAHEREACAKAGEDEIKRIKPLYSVTAENIVKAIRARGQQ